MSIPPTVSAAILTKVKIEFFDLVFLSMLVCPYVTMSILEFTNDLSNSILKISVYP